MAIASHLDLYLSAAVFHGRDRRCCASNSLWCFDHPYWCHIYAYAHSLGLINSVNLIVRGERTLVGKVEYKRRRYEGVKVNYVDVYPFRFTVLPLPVSRLIFGAFFSFLVTNMTRFTWSPRTDWLGMLVGSSVRPITVKVWSGCLRQSFSHRICDILFSIDPWHWYDWGGHVPSAEVVCNGTVFLVEGWLHACWVLYYTLIITIDMGWFSFW